MISEKDLEELKAEGRDRSAKERDTVMGNEKGQWDVCPVCKSPDYEMHRLCSCEYASQVKVCRWCKAVRL